MMKYGEFIDAINKANSIAIIIHKRPDGDAYGCGLSLFSIAQTLGKRSAIFCEDTVCAQRYNDLKGIGEIKAASDEKFDLAVALDCSNLERTGVCSRILQSAKKTIAVDHHKSHERFTQNLILEPEVCATAEILTRIFMQANWLNNDTARLLFVGIVTDSGIFSYDSVTAQTHEMVAKLYAYDFDKSATISKVQKERPKKVFDLIAKVLPRVKFYSNDEIGLLTMTRTDFDETGCADADTEGLISMILDVDCVRVAFSVSEAAPNSYRISIRTKRGLDASAIAANFGGGGHTAAAGCRLSGFFEDVIAKLIRAAEIELQR